MRSEAEIRKEILRAEGKVKKLKKELRSVQPGVPKRKRYIYVLKCKDNHYYVGQTVNIARRMREHQDGRGGWFTIQHPPIGIIDNFYAGYLTEDEALVYENQTTAQYMDIYSIDTVRGGMFNTRNKKNWENRVCEWLIT